MKRDSNNKYTTKFDTTYATGNTNSLTSKWAKVPTNQAPQTIKHTEDTPQAAGDNTTVYYAANVPKNKTAGQYQTTITYTATANVLDPPEVEKVEPSTIRQGLQMTIGEIPASGTVGQGNYQPAQTFACYLTTAGSVYCTGPTTVTESNSSSGNTTTHNYDYNKAWWMSNLAPTATQKVGSGTDSLSVQSYSPLVALTDTETLGPSWSKDVYNVRSYWFKLDTTGMDGGVVQGTTITLTGKNLSKVTNVYIDTNNNGILDEGTDISVSNLKITSDTQLTFTAPSMSAGTYNIIVVNPGNVVPGGTLTYR